MAGVDRNTATRDRHRRAIQRGHPDCGSEHHDCSQKHPHCGICGEPIDYELPHLDPWEFVVDHVVPIAAGGPDELWNKQAAHRFCNGEKSDRLADQLPVGITFTTTRSW
ncbi:HNH endonuclease [Mycobacterium phage Terror]|uniref:HNH endonuclease n=1 Tax=Mycobacterium phage Taheera TaxID=1897549 RepID=A0A1D8EVU5_9CAUD|nr:HNH endonuclease [Mycobacterium phage Taheera]AOT25169.1 HNH endonuclease [Mycobacterium phage Taheera]AOT25227.1 HNH endonuclease [Mycobacterium phage Terror]